MTGQQLFIVDYQTSNLLILLSPLFILFGFFDYECANIIV